MLLPGLGERKGFWKSARAATGMGRLATMPVPSGEAAVEEEEEEEPQPARASTLRKIARLISAVVPAAPPRACGQVAKVAGRSATPATPCPPPGRLPSYAVGFQTLSQVGRLRLQRKALEPVLLPEGGGSVCCLG